MRMRRCETCNERDRLLRGALVVFMRQYWPEFSDEVEPGDVSGIPDFPESCPIGVHILKVPITLGARLFSSISPQTNGLLKRGACRLIHLGAGPCVQYLMPASI